MTDPAEAQEVLLKKFRPLAPDFHRHMTEANLRGRTCRVGDRVTVYEVTATSPGGIVMVTDRTLIRFE